MTQDERRTLDRLLGNYNQARRNHASSEEYHELVNFVARITQHRDALKEAGEAVIRHSSPDPSSPSGWSSCMINSLHCLRWAVQSATPRPEPPELRDPPQGRTLMDVFAGTGLDTALNGAFEAMEPFRDAMDRHRYTAAPMHDSVVAVIPSVHNGGSIEDALDLRYVVPTGPTCEPRNPNTPRARDITEEMRELEQRVMRAMQIPPAVFASIRQIDQEPCIPNLRDPPGATAPQLRPKRRRIQNLPNGGEL